MSTFTDRLNKAKPKNDMNNEGSKNNTLSAPEEKKITRAELLRQSGSSVSDFGIDVGSKKEIENLLSEGMAFIGPSNKFYSGLQVRKDFPEHEIFEMSETLKSEGQLQYIVVWPKDENGLYKIDKGECRWRASKLIEGFQLKAIIDPEAPFRNTTDRIYGQLIENDRKNQLNPIELALSLVELADEGQTHSEIATRMGWLIKGKKEPNRNKVGRLIGLLKLPDDGILLAKKRVIDDIITLEYLRKIYELDVEKYNILVDMAKDRTLTRIIAADILKQIKLNLSHSSESSKLESHIADRVVVNGGDKIKGLDPGDGLGANCQTEGSESSSLNHNESSHLVDTPDLNVGTVPDTESIKDSHQLTGNPVMKIQMNNGDILDFNYLKHHPSGIIGYANTSDNKEIEIKLSDIVKIKSFSNKIMEKV